MGPSLPTPLPLTALVNSPTIPSHQTSQSHAGHGWGTPPATPPATAPAVICNGIAFGIAETSSTTLAAGAAWVAGPYLGNTAMAAASPCGSTAMGNGSAFGNVVMGTVFLLAPHQWAVGLPLAMQQLAARCEHSAR